MPHHSAVGIACCKIEKIFFHSSLTRSNYSEKSSGMLDKLINYVHDLEFRRIAQDEYCRRKGKKM